jgi:hypothetical protein
MTAPAAVAFIRSAVERHGLVLEGQLVLVPCSQAALATEAGLSRGTVAAHVRQLGPVVSTTRDGLVVDVAALERHRLGTTGVPLQDILGRIVDGLTALTAYLDGEVRDGTVAPLAQMRDASVAPIAQMRDRRDGAVAHVTQPGGSVPAGQGHPSFTAGGPDVRDVVAHPGQLASFSSSTSRELASSGLGATPIAPEALAGVRTKRLSSDAEIDAALEPVVAYARRCSPPLATALNDEGRRWLGLYSPAELAHGAAEVLARIKTGRKVSSPVGLLVSMARRGEEEFFAVPAAPPARATLAEDPLPPVDPAAATKLAAARAGLRTQESA